MTFEDFLKLAITYVIYGIYLLIFIGIANLVSNAIPFSFFHFWKFDGSWEEIFASSWGLYVWGVGATIGLRLIFGGRALRDPEEAWGKGLLMSVWAGVVEEVFFRWLVFYAAIATLKLVNLLFFGFLGFGIAEWFYTNALCPVANFVTLGYLEPYVLNGAFGWAICAAVISSNGKFRDGHSYQGPIGWINSWFLGMIFFYLTFKYGLPAAIFVHFLYDVCVFTTQYGIAVCERFSWRRRRAAEFAAERARYSSVSYR